MEKLLPAEDGPVERCCKDGIDIKKGKRWDDEVGLIDLAEFHGLEALAFHQQNPGQNRSDQNNHRQCGDITLHAVTPLGSRRNRFAFSCNNTPYELPKGKMNDTWMVCIL